MGVRNRAFVAGSFGQGAGLVATLGIQLLQVPLLVAHLGAAGFGSYLLVIAVPSLLTLSDFGLLAAFSTAMLQAVSVGKLDEARRLSKLVSGLLVIGGSFFVLLILAGGAALPALMTEFPPWGQLVFVLYGLYALVGLQTSAIEGVFRAQGDQAVAWAAIALIRLVEFGMGALLISLIGDVVAFVGGLLVGRGLGAVVLQIAASCRAPWSSRVPSLKDRRTYAYLWRPMIGSMAQPASNYVYMQGTTLAVGAILGSVAVAELGVLRTLAGLVRQCAQVLTLASMPLITRAATVGDVQTLQRQRRVLIATVLPVTAAGAIGLALLAPLIIRIWTSGTISVSWDVAVALAIEISLEVLVLLLALPLIARNQHGVFGVVGLVIALVYLVAVAVWPDANLTSVLLTQAAAMVLTAGVALREGRHRR